MILFKCVQPVKNSKQKHLAFHLNYILNSSSQWKHLKIKILERLISTKGRGDSRSGLTYFCSKNFYTETLRYLNHALFLENSLWIHYIFTHHMALPLAHMHIVLHLNKRKKKSASGLFMLLLQYHRCPWRTEMLAGACVYVSESFYLTSYCVSQKRKKKKEREKGGQGAVNLAQRSSLMVKSELLPCHSRLKPYTCRNTLHSPRPLSSPDCKGSTGTIDTFK